MPIDYQIPSHMEGFRPPRPEPLAQNVWSMRGATPDPDDEDGSESELEPAAEKKPVKSPAKQLAPVAAPADKEK